MAWRPTQYLIEGELDNTEPGKVSGWMQFAGLKGKVTFALAGNFHRDIRGAKVRLKGDGQPGDFAAANFMSGLATHQTGQVGDMTAGRPPTDYVSYPYFEWYSNQNGRVVLELSRDQIEIVGRPIPACESDPVSREEQAGNMADFLAGLSRDIGAPAIAVSRCGPTLVSDPEFSHWVVDGGRIIGEAHSVKRASGGRSLAFVRLFAMPEMAEYGYVATASLRVKSSGAHA